MTTNWEDKDWEPDTPNKINPRAAQRLTLDSFLISDTHFGHKNIIKYCNRPMNHEQVIIQNWTKVVKPTDDLLHQGDLTVFYGKNQKEWERKCSMLPGIKRIILGNHDGRSPSFYRSLGFGVWMPFIQKFGDLRVLFTHYPKFHLPDSNWDLNIHGHSHTHRKKKWSKFHINISIENMDYSPVRLKEILP